MKKSWIIISTSIILFVSIFFIELNLCKLSYKKNEKESKKVLELAYSIIENQNSHNNKNNFLRNKFAIQLEKNNKLIQNNISEISDNVDSKLNSKEDIVCNMDIIGILIIPKLQIEAPIKDGTTQEVMRTSIGHFIESDYWDGNVSFASHNSGISAHYFEKIYSLNIDDEIEYITKLGTKKYKVKDIKQIESTDWSMVIKNDNQSENEKNTITLITCINGKPNYRLCVRGVEV